MPTLNLAPASTSDFRRLAEQKLPRFLFDYVDGGAYQERTLGANVSDFEDLQLKQRVMVDVSKLDSSLQLLSRDWSMPLALAPVGMAGMMAQRGETQAKAAADAMGVPFCLSTVGICSLEEVAGVSDTPFWFQLYMLKDRGIIKELLQRAKSVGVRTLLFTVDLAVVGARYRDVRNGMGPGASSYGRLRGGLLSYMLHPDWAMSVGLGGKPHTFGNLTAYVPKATTPVDFKAWIDSQIDASVTWKDIEWLRSVWEGDLIIKGVLSPEDAVSASKAGADGVVVSNHGGRQLDGVSSSIAMLPQIAEALKGERIIFVDGGVRSGQDIVKARALGAHAVLIGRPWVYAMAARGEAGVRSLLTAMKAELDVSMALTGCASVSEIARSVLGENPANHNRKLP